MRKIVLISVLVLMMSINVAAYAETETETAAYTGGSNNAAKVTNVENYSTVLITKASANPITSDDIIYVDQADNSFESTKNFLLKANPSVGLYNVTLGKADGDTATATFYIGVSSNSQNSDTPMTRLSYTAETTEGVKTYYTAGFELVTTSTAFSGYKTVKVGYNNGTNNIYGGFPIDEHWRAPVTSGEGSIMLVFVLDHIEEDELPSVSVFLSTDDLQEGAIKGSGYRE